MAAKKKATAVDVPSINLALLQALATAPGGFLFVGPTDFNPLLNHIPPLVEVNNTMSNPADATQLATRITEVGKAKLAEGSVVPVAAPKAATVFAIITNAVLPDSKRGNHKAGAPKKYPFDDLEIGGTFFVPVSAEMPDPVKTLGSTVSSANIRFSVPTGEKETKERTKRGPGNKAVKNADGTNQKETVTVDKKRATRKFRITPVKVGEKYGDWVAPSDGALIGRVALPTS